MEQTQGLLMKECKHRWEVSNFGIKHRTPDHVMYECQRCHKLISTLKPEQEKQDDTRLPTP